MRALTRTCWSAIVLSILILHVYSIKIQNDPVQEVAVKEDVTPGPFWNSFIVNSPQKAKEVCDNLAGDPPEISCFSSKQPPNEQVHTQSIECLKNRLEGRGGIYAKMCALCAAPYLDGVAWGSRDRAGLRCTARYIALNRFASAIRESDELIVPQITAAVNFIKASQHQFNNLEDAIRKDPAEGGDHPFEALRNAQYERIADIDNDGKISRREMEAYMQAIYVVASDAPEVVVGSTDANSTAPFRENWMRAYNWLRFMPNKPDDKEDAPSQPLLPSQPDKPNDKDGATHKESVPPEPSPPSEQSGEAMPGQLNDAIYAEARRLPSGWPLPNKPFMPGRFRNPMPVSLNKMSSPRAPPQLFLPPQQTGQVTPGLDNALFNGPFYQAHHWPRSDRTFMPRRLRNPSFLGLNKMGVPSQSFPLPQQIDAFYDEARRPPYSLPRPGRPFMPRRFRDPPTLGLEKLERSPELFPLRQQTGQIMHGPLDDTIYDEARHLPYRLRRSDRPFSPGRFRNPANLGLEKMEAPPQLFPLQQQTGQVMHRHLDDALYNEARQLPYQLQGPGRPYIRARRRRRRPRRMRRRRAPLSLN